MKIVAKNTAIRKINNDDDFYEAWKQVNYLDGYATAIIDASNDDIDVEDSEAALKECKKVDRKRNKLIGLMNKYRDKPDDLEDE